MKQAVHGWLPTYERLVKSQNFFSSYLTQEDLSRLGRHRTQTALFIDYLRERGVRVISVTEGLDTVSDKDDLVISVRGLMNDYYARDIGKKIRTGYRQKQRDGIVSLLPLAIGKIATSTRSSSIQRQRKPFG